MGVNNYQCLKKLVSGFLAVFLLVFIEFYHYNLRFFPRKIYCLDLLLFLTFMNSSKFSLNF